MHHSQTTEDTPLQHLQRVSSSRSSTVESWHVLCLFSFIILKCLLYCRCVLKMDHHCRILWARKNSWKWLLFCSPFVLVSPGVPACYTYWTELFPAWLNNCVGHFNHRYFFSFCIYMTMGCIYCSISSRNLFLDAYNAVEVRLDKERFNHPYVWVAFSSWQLQLIVPVQLRSILTRHIPLSRF